MNLPASAISALHACPTQLVMAITGGGSRAIAELLEVPGGSATLLEAIVPYAADSLSEFLGGAPDQFCSEETARAMAMRAFCRGQQLLAKSHDGGHPPGTSPKPNNPAPSSSDQAPLLLGVGCTASLVSQTPKRGPHRLHLGLQVADWTETTSLVLDKGARNRQQEERLVADLLLWRVLSASGIPCPTPTDLRDDETPKIQRTVAPADWRALLLGQIKQTRWPALPSDTRPQTVSRRLIFSGAFHPLHHGHRRMAQWAAATFGGQVEFEISIENVDKPPLNYTDLESRVAQFSADQTLWLTRAPTFAAKSDVFPGATFLVGADTITRIGNPKYYGGSEGCRLALQQLADRDCRFFVFGRLGEDGFACLEDLDLPPDLRKLCLGVPANEFRVDVSSTELRKGERDTE